MSLAKERRRLCGDARKAKKPLTAAKVNLLSVMLMASIVFASCVALIPEAKAGSGINLIGGYGTPTIDGKLQADEWAAAAKATFGPFTADGQTITGTLYMMNDGVNLYIGVIIEGDDDFTNGDGFRVYFDNDWGAETSLEQGDDCVGAFGATGFDDLYFDATLGLQMDPSQDGQAAGARQGTANHFELSHPLDSADDEHDFSLSGGQWVGFAFQPMVDFIYYPVSAWGLGDFARPDTYANYLVASPPTPPPPRPLPYVGGEVYSPNKLAILAPYLALLGLASAVAVVVKRRKH